MIYNFYVTLVILSIVYTTTTFGTGETALSEVTKKVPEDIYNLIDEFRGENDGVFKETGYIKPYSRLLDLISEYSPAICATVVFLLTVIKLPSKINLSFTSLFFGVLAMVSYSYLFAWVTWFAVHIVMTTSPLFVKNHQDEKFPEMLSIENPQGEEFPENDKEYICITKHFIRRNGIVIEVGTHYRPLSDMRPKNKAPSNHMLQVGCFPGRQNLGKNKPSVFFRLEEGEINAYLPDDYQKSENKLHGLSTPERINSFALFKKGRMMVTSSERGIIQWESERNKKLYQIMNSTGAMQYNQSSD